MAVFFFAWKRYRPVAGHPRMRLDVRQSDALRRVLAEHLQD